MLTTTEVKQARMSLGYCDIGERGSLHFFVQSDQLGDGSFKPRWLEPSISIDCGNGESASISLQHMDSKKLHKLSDFIKRIAIQMEGFKL